jgi:hypothetical protein
MNVLLIEKNGKLKNTVIKKFSKDELYKKCGFKKNDDFIKQYHWVIDNENIIELYGKNKGKQNNINIYPFPIKDAKFYGNSILLLLTNGEYQSITQPIIETFKNYEISSSNVFNVNDDDNENDNKNDIEEYEYMSNEDYDSDIFKEIVEDESTINDTILINLNQELVEEPYEE